jgi:hypothetical protein
MLDRTTTALIKDIKRMGSIPSSQDLYEDSDFVDAMNDCQASTVIPQIMKVREEFLVDTFTTPCVVGQRDYDLPVRAVGGKVRQIIMIDTQGNEVRLSRIEPENKTWHENYMWWPGTKSGYYFEGNKIWLTPNLQNMYTSVQIKYFRRPSELTLTSLAAQVISINPTSGWVTVDKIPTGWAANRMLDGQKVDSPFNSKFDSVAALNIDLNANGVQLPPATAALLAAGDWICDEGECVIPQYPVELHRILTNYVLIDVLRHLGDTQGAMNMAADLQEAIDNFNTLISNRDEGSPRKVFSRRGIWDTGGV